MNRRLAVPFGGLAGLAVGVIFAVARAILKDRAHVPAGPKGDEPAAEG
jgi:hypothetical protein